ncbi:MAG: hypothetical protein GF344_08165 [Chitinivibrionales bacterium]|nr:hypothetical protein [Chitinivibrionales bacterium]MBD3356851.1 hypothetical protein [Chitinivibrionales bacterium]
MQKRSIRSQSRNNEKKVLPINPPVFFVNYLQLQWYNAAHPISLLKLMRYATEQSHSVRFIDCMDYDVNTRKTPRF